MPSILIALAALAARPTATRAQSCFGVKVLAR
jgi:hypothetical protein